jgi:hypothetical protein
LDHLETRTLKRKALDEFFEPQKKCCLEQESNSDERNSKLLAYKRLWEALDMSNPLDAQLEPFLWHKIRSLSASHSS